MGKNGSGKSAVVLQFTRNVFVEEYGWPKEKTTIVKEKDMQKEIIFSSTQSKPLLFSSSLLFSSVSYLLLLAFRPNSWWLLSKTRCIWWELDASRNLWIYIPSRWSSRSPAGYTFTLSEISLLLSFFFFSVDVKDNTSCYCVVFHYRSRDIWSCQAVPWAHSHGRNFANQNCSPSWVQ